MSSYGNPHTLQDRTKLALLTAKQRFGLRVDDCPKEWSQDTIDAVLAAKEPPLPKQPVKLSKHNNAIQNQRRISLAVVPSASAETVEINTNWAEHATKLKNYFVAAVCVHACLTKRYVLLLPESSRLCVDRLVRTFEHTAGIPTMFGPATAKEHIVVISTSMFSNVERVYVFGALDTLRAYQLALYCKYASSTMCAAPIKQAQDNVMMETRRPLDILSTLVDNEDLTSTQLEVIAETIFQFLAIRITDKRCKKKPLPNANWPDELRALDKIHEHALATKLESELKELRKDQDLRVGSVVHCMCFCALTKGEYVAVCQRTFYDNNWDLILFALLSAKPGADETESGQAIVALYELLYRIQCNSDFYHQGCSVVALRNTEHLTSRQVLRTLSSCTLLTASQQQWLLSVMYVGPNPRCFNFCTEQGGQLRMLDMQYKKMHFRCMFAGKRKNNALVNTPNTPRKKLACDVMRVVQNMSCGSHKECLDTQQAIIKTDTQTNEVSHISIASAIFKIA